MVVRRILKWLFPLWLMAVVGCGAAHGFGDAVVSVVSTLLWAVVLLAVAVAAARLTGRGRKVLATAVLVAGALVAIDAAVVLDSFLLYDVLGHWHLDGGVGLPYSYGPLWFPASLWSGDTLFGVSQDAIRAGDFEWQQEQVQPVSVVLLVLSVFFVLAGSLPRRDETAG